MRLPAGSRTAQSRTPYGPVGGADRDPAHPAVSDIVADLEAEGVAIEGQGGVRLVVREEARVNRDAHDGHASCGSGTRASRFLIGLVTCFAAEVPGRHVRATGRRPHVRGSEPTTTRLPPARDKRRLSPLTQATAGRLHCRPQMRPLDDRQRVLSVCDDRSAYGRLLVPPPLSKSGQLGHGQQEGGIFQRLEAVTAIWHDKQVPPVGLPREVSG